MKIHLGRGMAIAVALLEPTMAADDATRLRELFDARIDADVAQVTSKPGNNAMGGIAWGGSYLLSALVEMLDATGDARYAELFVKLAGWTADARDNLHDRRDMFRDRLLPAWGSTKYSAGKHYVWAVHTGMIAEPLARFAWVVNRHAGIKEKYASPAERFLAVAREAVTAHDDQFREGPQPGEGYLYGIYTKQHLPLNMQNALVRAWIAIDDATGQPRYRERIEKLARFFKNRIRIENGAYAWEYRPPLDGSGKAYEDISHASINVDFAVICCEHGLVFTRADLDDFAATLLDRVLLPDGRANDHVGGKGGFDKYRPAILQWSSLARHNPHVCTRLVPLACREEFEHGPPTVLLGWARLYRSLRAPASLPAATRAAEQ